MVAAERVDGAGARELVRQVGRGDQQALAALYDRSADRLYSLACRILGEGPEAEEAVSDAFVQVWESAGSFDPERGSVDAWLTMILRSRALDRLRARKRRHAAHERAERNSLPGNAPAAPSRPVAPDVDAEHRERARRVEEALTRLPESNRSAIRLAFFEGLSHREVATRLDEPLGTVKSRIRLGLMKLRDELASLQEGGVR